MQDCMPVEVSVHICAFDSIIIHAVVVHFTIRSIQSIVLHVYTDSCVSTTRVEHEVRGEEQSTQIKYKDLNQR